MLKQLLRRKHCLLRMSHNFTTFALLPCLRRSVREDDHVRGWIIPLAFLVPNYKQFSWFSPGIFHSPVSTHTLTLRTKTITTIHTTKSHISANFLTKTSLLRISIKNPVSRLVFCIEKVANCYQVWTSVRRIWSEKQLVYN